MRSTVDTMATTPLISMCAKYVKFVYDHGLLDGGTANKQILEKSLRGEDTGGADLALWPAATKVLKELGVGSTEPPGGDEFVDLSDFWGRKTYHVQFVRICKVDSSDTAADGSSSKSDGTPIAAVGQAIAAAPETVLTTVDMGAVVDGEGEPFRLVGRQAVMSALLPLVENDSVRRGVRVVRAEQSTQPGEPTAAAHIVKTGASDENSPSERVNCRVLVGADGIHSVCRVEVSAFAALVSTLRDEDGGTASTSAREDPAAAATAVRATGARDGGEVCYRGVLDLRDGSPASEAGLRAMFEEDEEKRPNSMSVVYGDRLRFSWGFIDGARETGYWFVKQLTTTTKKKSSSDGGVESAQQDADVQRLGKGWPEPLKTFAAMTGDECSYAHRIQDRPPLDRYEIVRVPGLGCLILLWGSALSFALSKQRRMKEKALEYLCTR